MLFKTISASVYGIDAYFVEVEVDVGSARMQDFNVVGLPDNAVKESRERIKSALRNCGFESLWPLRNHQSRSRRRTKGRLRLRFTHGPGLGRMHGPIFWQAPGPMHVSRRIIAGRRRPASPRRSLHAIKD
jgi:Subunit ChlI of Mg-chelatase